MRPIIPVLMIVSLLLISGCAEPVTKYQCWDGSIMESIENCPAPEVPELSPWPEPEPSPTPETPSEEVTPPEKICVNIGAEARQKQCLVYETGNPDYCEDDSCYSELSRYLGIDACSEISDVVERWFCRAIVKQDINECKYATSLEFELGCINSYILHYNDATACDIYKQKEEDLINAGYYLCIRDKFGHNVPLESLTQANLSEGATEQCNFERKCWCKLGPLKSEWNEVSCLWSVEVNQRSAEEKREIKLKDLCPKINCPAVYGPNYYDCYDCSTFYNADCQSLNEDERTIRNCFHWQARKEKDHTKCLLMRGDSPNVRDECLSHVASLSKDISICDEMSSQDKKTSCIEQYAREVDVNVCLEPFNYDCILDAVSAMAGRGQQNWEYGQDIDCNICGNVERIVDRDNCYIECVKAKFYRDNTN